MEIDGENVYSIGSDGVLVHNSCESAILGRNLTNDGYGIRPLDFEAAHIVPTGAFSRRHTANLVKDIQQQFDRYLPGQRNDSINGFWADTGRHAGTHTDKYVQALSDEFDMVTDAQSAKDAMARIWTRIESGEFN